MSETMQLILYTLSFFVYTLVGVYIFKNALDSIEPPKQISNAHVRSRPDGDIPEAKCIHCGEPIYRQSERGAWVHSTFEDGGYISCATHKKGYAEPGHPGGAPFAEPDKALFPDPPPIVYRHFLELHSPINYDSLENFTAITFAKDFVGDHAITVYYDSAGEKVMDKIISMDFSTMDRLISWYQFRQQPAFYE